MVGKPTQETPLLTETMKFITVNPTWNVPQSIIYNELLPIYESGDPQIFERQGLKVERGRDGSIRVYQPPGERNALGRIRFNFPNKFLVYQHDTPEKHYFAHDRRAYSHGCMRVQDPIKYAEVLLSYAAPKLDHTQARIKQMFGGEEQQIDFRPRSRSTSPTRPRSWTSRASCRSATTSTASTPGCCRSCAAANGSVADVAIERPADPNFKPIGRGDAPAERRGARRRPQLVFAVRTAFPLKHARNRRRTGPVFTSALTISACRIGLDSQAIFRHTPPVRLALGGR